MTRYCTQDLAQLETMVAKVHQLQGPERQHPKYSRTRRRSAKVSWPARRSHLELSSMALMKASPSSV
jgi:hypothetical protein